VNAAQVSLHGILKRAFGVAVDRNVAMKLAESMVINHSAKKSGRLLANRPAVSFA
jgi:hypothetical protein